MTDERSLDELGPVDYLIVEFPAGAQNFTGEGADELFGSTTPGSSGSWTPHPPEERGRFGRRAGVVRPPRARRAPPIEGQLAQTLAEEDVENLAAAMDPGSVAGVLVYENVWAAPFASAMRRAGGQLIANGRIPIQAIIAAVEADAELEAQGV